METSGPTPRSRPRNGRRTTAPPGAAARPASRSSVLPLAGTLFAVAAYHLVFGSMFGPAPAWDTRTVAAAVLFHTALSLRLALPQDGTGRTRWALA
ncbi:hypothetical protein G3I23_19155, partial [Streptomyces sp. SID10115]